MAKRRRYVKRSKKPHYRKKRSGGRRRATKTTKKMVRRTIVNMAETKSMQQYVYATTPPPTTDAGFDASIRVVGPSGGTLPISQGTGQANRVGNKIQTQSCTLKGALLPLPYNATTNPNPRPMVVTMFFFLDRRSPNTIPTPQASADFYQNGNGAGTFDTELVDGLAPVNTDCYRIFMKRTFRVGCASYAGTGNLPAQQNYSNNDFPMLVRFKLNVTKHLPKTYKFADNNTSPTNRRLYWMCLVNWADGNAMSATTRPLEMQFIQDYRWKDL